MKEKDYNKWVKAKSEVEHFNELDEDVKKVIYDIEQTFEDADEIELEEINIKDKEAYFHWIGFEKEVELVKEDYDCDEDEAERIADSIRHDQLAEYLNDYTHNFHDWIFCVWWICILNAIDIYWINITIL